MGTAVASPVYGSVAPISTLLALLILPLKSKRPWPRSAKWLVFAGILAGAALWLSSLANGVQQSIALPFVAVTVVFLAAALKTTNGVETAATSLFWVALGSSVAVYFYGTYTRVSPEFYWKFGGAWPVLVVALYLAAKGKRFRGLLTAAVLVAGMLVSFWAEFRSGAVLCLTVLVIMIARAGRRRLELFTLVVMVGVLLVAYVLLFDALAAGTFGAALQAKTQIQGESGAFGFRVEPPLSIAAIMARPFLGWGNINSIDNATINEGARIAAGFGQTDSRAYAPIWFRSDGSVSLHSIALSLWAEGGILAFVFPVLAFGALAGAVVFARGAYATVVTTASVFWIWDLLFSPWSTNRAVMLAATLVAATWVLADRARGRTYDTGMVTSSPPRVAERLS